jgi:hypothetical protein
MKMDGLHCHFFLAVLTCSACLCGLSPRIYWEEERKTKGGAVIYITRTPIRTYSTERLRLTYLYAFYVQCVEHL